MPNRPCVRGGNVRKQAAPGSRHLSATDQHYPFAAPVEPVEIARFSLIAVHPEVDIQVHARHTPTSSEFGRASLEFSVVFLVQVLHASPSRHRNRRVFFVTHLRNLCGRQRIEWDLEDLFRMTLQWKDFGLTGLTGCVTTGRRFPG